MINERKEDRYEYMDIEFDLDEYIKKAEISSDFPRNGIIILPYDKWGRFRCNIFMPETFNFVKWIKQKEGVEENISILEEKEKRKKIAELRSATIWLPLVYLFSDVTLPIYLNIVANYLYDRFKGSLRNDRCEVNLEVLIGNKCNKKTKKFSYKGSYQGFKEIMKQFDFEKMMDNK